MKNRFFHIILFSLFLSRCALPQFSFKPGGGNGEEINANTVQVDFLKITVPLEELFYPLHLQKA